MQCKWLDDKCQHGYNIDDLKVSYTPSKHLCPEGASAGVLNRDLGPVDQAAAFRMVNDLSASERRVARARRWIETCVDPIAVGSDRKQAMLDYLDGKRDVPDDIAALTEVQAAEVPSAGEDGAAWFDHDEPIRTPAPVVGLEALAAVVHDTLMDSTTVDARAGSLEVADAILAAGYVKGRQDTPVPKEESNRTVWGDVAGEKCGGCRGLGPHTYNAACEYAVPLPFYNDDKDEQQ